ncbi:ROK family protein [Cesiribacter sp. SM1]|uniref:ROK family transcriptional regulator n=1 Tax=Cesiribacter sp. SM1 TaxID=2861196 RepID=UPI001CD1998E|nr:ROK family protein [Cesiribacter sp. SM1]
MSTIIKGESYLDTLNNVERKKHTQKIKIIKHLYVKGSRTNSELCNVIGMSSPTSMSLLNELMSEGLVEKQGRAKSEGGRKPDLYGLRDNSLFVLSIAMGRFKTRMAIFDNNNNNITGIKTFPIRVSDGIGAHELLYQHAQDVISSSGIDTRKLMGVGLNMPGLVDSKEGNNFTYMNPPEGSPSLQQLLEDKFQKPVHIENDVKASALAEYRFGLAHGKKDVLVLSLDWGIGLGVILDGKLQRGTTGYSGEIGHIPFVNDGALCYCGKRGCLETVASGIALARLAKEGIKSGQNSLLNELSDQEIDRIEPQLVIDAANRGDQYAISILSQLGMNLGKGIAILMQLYNPELVILGGRIAEARQYITTPIQHSINIYCMTQIREKTTIALSKLGQNAGILGSVAVVMENIFEDVIDY